MTSAAAPARSPLFITHNCNLAVCSFLDSDWSGGNNQQKHFNWCSELSRPYIQTHIGMSQETLHIIVNLNCVITLLLCIHCFFNKIIIIIIIIFYFCLKAPVLQAHTHARTHTRTCACVGGCVCGCVCVCVCVCVW